MPPSRLPEDPRVASWRLSPGFGEGGLPVGAVGEDVQEPPARHESCIAGGDGSTCTAGRRLPEDRACHQPGLAVAAVVGEGLARPFAGDQDPATGVAEMLTAVGLALARPGPQASPGVLGLDAVAQPVRAAG